MARTVNIIFYTKNHLIIKPHIVVACNLMLQLIESTRFKSCSVIMKKVPSSRLGCVVTRMYEPVLLGLVCSPGVCRLGRRRPFMLIVESFMLKVKFCALFLCWGYVIVHCCYNSAYSLMCCGVLYVLSCIFLCAHFNPDYSFNTQYWIHTVVEEFLVQTW